MAVKEHKIVHVGFETKDQNRVLAAEQKRLNDDEAVLAQTKLEFEDVQEQRRLVQSSISAEIELDAKEKQHTQSCNFFAKKSGEVVQNFKLTNEIELLQRKLDEKSRLIAIISPVVNTCKVNSISV